MALVISLHHCLVLPDALGFGYSAGGEKKCYFPSVTALGQMGPKEIWTEVQRHLFQGRHFGL